MRYKETTTQRKRRLEKARQWHRNRKANETSPERKRRLEKWRIAAQIRRSNESAEQREERLCKDRERHTKISESRETSTVTHESEALDKNELFLEQPQDCLVEDSCLQVGCSITGQTVAVSHPTQSVQRVGEAPQASTLRKRFFYCN